MDKQSSVKPHNRMLLSNKKEQISNICNNTDESQKCAGQKRHTKNLVTLMHLRNMLSERIICKSVYDI